MVQSYIKYLHVLSGVQVCVQNKYFLLGQDALYHLSLSMNSLVLRNACSMGKLKGKTGYLKVKQ